MNILQKISIAITVAAVALGCGGSGGPSAGGGTPVSKATVLSVFQRGIGQATGQPGLDSQGRGKTRHHEEGDLYFDDWLQLWVVSDHEEPGIGYTYFADEQKTQPAGYDVYTETSAVPRVSERDLRYDAGAFAGEWHKERRTLQEDGTGSVEGSGLYPGLGSYVYDMIWDDSGLVTAWNEKFTYNDNTWDNFTSRHNADASRTLVWSNSAGIAFTLTFQPDFSGTGTITGNGEGLPATMQWDENGTGFIRWSDGSQTTFTGWAF